ncbi:hypothetical protein HNR42_003413 [Deinobacterium chartae]|uniref:Uncharacterized protein n=1 Tax=Deinobacterium chartae TaxID=521158 RepID=A0A841I3R3_9DEIO|nr:hypothetical protein [Deinobacterium chartae]MBB6099953.1 hypothetical protein [Deinobacterium chartae]
MKFWVTALLMWMAHAAAFQLTVFDPSLERVLGYAALEGNVLRLQLVEDNAGSVAGSFVLDGGGTQVLKGTLSDGNLNFNFPQGNMSLARYAQSQGWTLQVTRVGGSQRATPTKKDKDKQKR